MSNEQKLREALQQALTALENAITQVKYDEECAAAIIAARQTIATTEPEPVDEREAFEKWAAPNRFDVGHKGEDGSYLGLATSIAWAGWQARAAMAKWVKG